MLNRIKDIIDNATDDDLIVKLDKPPYRNQQMSDFKWKLHPYTCYYYLETNPCFTYNFKSIDEMNKYPSVHLRDGAINIFDFFCKNPVPPKNFKPLILIHRDIECFIPISWKDHVACYDFEFQTYEDKGKNIFITGFHYNYNHYQYSEKELFDIHKKSIKKDNVVHFLMPVRERPIFSEINESPRVVEMLKLIHTQLDREYKFYSTPEEVYLVQAKEEDGFKSFSGEKFFVADSYVDHILANAGVKKITEKSFEKSSLSYPLSFFHSVHFYEFNPARSLFKELVFDVKLKGYKADFFSLNCHEAIKEFVSNKKIFTLD